MLSPGEFVVRKAIVNRVGMENLVKFNAGVMSYAELLQAAMANQPKGSKRKGGGGLGAVEFFNGGGLVQPPPPGNQPPGPDFGGFGSGGSEGGMYFGDINIINPEPERGSDSMTRTVRKLSYLGGRP
jgi:hypothetical protein